MADFAVWQQNAAYPARQDRVLVSELLVDEGVLDLSGGALLVTERSAGANMSVDVAAGRCVVDGDEQANQETYLCVFDDATNLTVASADPDQARKDRVIVRVQDSAVSGSTDGPLREVVTGTVGSGSAPSVPDSAISLAIIDVPAGANSITDTEITDDRSEGGTGAAEDPHDDSAHSNAYARANMQVFTADGTFTVPADIERVTFALVGGGGGGGGAGNNGDAASGGGGGGAGIKGTMAVTPGEDITVTVGSGGAGAADGTGGSGGSSSFGSHTADGGAGGDKFDTGGAGGSTPTSGDLAVAGQDGGTGGRSSGVIAISGAGGSSLLGGGAPAVASTGAADGISGVLPGAGGSGGAVETDNSTTGGTGGDGVVIIEW